MRTQSAAPTRVSVNLVLLRLRCGIISRHRATRLLLFSCPKEPSLMEKADRAANFRTSIPPAQHH
jgi:hypothetical protein